MEEEVRNEFGEAPASPPVRYDPVADIPNEEGKLAMDQPAIEGGGPRNQLAADAPQEPWSEEEVAFQEDMPVTTANDLNADMPVRAQAPPPPVSDHYAIERTQFDTIIKGRPVGEEEFADSLRQYKEGARTVEDEMISVVEQAYNDVFLDQGVLDDIDTLSPEEKYRKLHSEFMRLNANKTEVRNLIGLNMMRQGLGQAPSDVLDGIWRQTTPNQARAMLEQYRKVHIDEMNQLVDAIAAAQATDWDLEQVVKDVAFQDVMPFYGATTRVIGTNKFLPDGVDIGWFRRGFPGEVRQEIREWWITATPQERETWLKDLQTTWEQIRKGPNSRYFTRYLVTENLVGTFTEDLLYSSDPTDTFDRIFGNLDTALGAILAVGLIAKKGKSVFELFKSGKYNHSKQIAAAGGARAAEDAVNNTILDQAQQLGYTVDEIAVANLTPPKQLELDFGLPVQTDRVKHTTSPNAERTARILEYTDDADVILLSNEDLGNATRRVLEELEDMDGVHVMHKMSTVRGLPNNTGIEVGVTLGQAGNRGWDSIKKLLDDMEQLDPHQEFVIYRRGADGQLEEVNVGFSDIVDYYATRKFPKAFDEFIEMNEDQLEVARYFGGRRIDTVSSEELASALDSGWIPPDMPAWGVVRRELNARADPKVLDEVNDALKFVDGEEFYVRFNHTKYFDAEDAPKEAWNFFKWWGGNRLWRLGGRLFPPNSKFGRMYQASRRAYHMEEATLAEFADILAPYNGLSKGDRRTVAGIIEEVEDYAKDMYHETGLAKAPDEAYLRQKFPDASEAAWEGYYAMRDAMDGMYEVLNRRLYRDFNNRGFRTMRGTDDSLPNYSGRVLDQHEVKGGSYYDPVKRELVTLTDDEAKALSVEGGSIMELDLPITDKNGQRFDRVLARKGDYEVGKLSESPLIKHEGYHFRFYEDPFYIIKRTYDPTLNGRVITKADIDAGRAKGYHVDEEGRVYFDEATATAFSHREAETFINRGSKKKGRVYQDDGKGKYVRGDDDPVWIIRPSRQINNTEGSLYTTQQLHTEGRLFWDERSYERLPDTRGNRAKISDPSHAMEKGLALAMRQSTQEGLFKAIKNTFKNDYGDLPRFTEKKFKLEGDELRDLERDLIEGRNESWGQTRERYKQALEIIRYLRTQMGTDTFAVPYIRQWLLSASTTIERYMGGSSRLAGWAQRKSMALDPFASARRIAYNTFMVLRPFRQALLQSSQISFLMGIAPTYIGSGRIMFDTFALRRGLLRFRKAGLDDGWSDSKLAKAMGLSKKEYRRLVEEYQRSGLMGSVNTHAFNAQGRNLQATLDPNAGRAGRFMYDVRSRGRSAMNFMAKWGFEFGEQNNLTMSWLVALKRYQRTNKIDDLTKMSRSQWNEVAAHADSLALAMTRPNKFGYQSGVSGMVFQFMSFQHRAFLTMIGLNPAVSKAETLKIVAFNLGLWGANIFGGEELAREWLNSMGIDGSQKLFGEVSLQDALAAGLIENGFNSLGRALSDNWTDLNIGILAPGAALPTLYQSLMEFWASAPSDDPNFLGPVANPVLGISKALLFIRGDLNNATMGPGEKLVRAAKFMLTEPLPQMNDANQAYLAWKFGEWRDKDGDKLGIQSSYNSIIARATFGIRPKEEYSIYRTRTLHWKNRENIDDFVDKWKPYIKQLATQYIDSNWTADEVVERMSVVRSLVEDAPEGVRAEIFKRLITEPDLQGTSIADILAEALTTASFTLQDMLPYVENSQTLTAEQKMQLRMIVKQGVEANATKDKKLMDQVDKELAERGVE